MTQIWEFLYREFKVSLINILRALIEEVDNVQEQLDDTSREMETRRKDRNEMLEVTHTVKKRGMLLKGSSVE